MSAPQFTTAWLVAHEAERRAKKRTQRITRPQPKTEADIQFEIAEWLRGQRAFFVWHRTDKPSTAQVGTPDFVGCSKSFGPFALEVKKPGGKETREQAGALMHAQLEGMRSGVVHSLEEAVAFLTQIPSGKQPDAGTTPR
jgi:hypothetical protein